MVVRVTYASPGEKKFEVLLESGSTFVQKRVFRRLIEAEKEAARRPSFDQLRFDPRNYDLRLEGTEMVNGRMCYVLTINPKERNKYLLRGRAWIDNEDFGVARLEGIPAESWSFWVRTTRVLQQYRKVGGFWMPVLHESDSHVRIVGPAHLRIEYLDYEINQNSVALEPPR
jgi:hypothetical protein